jgi:hypothetical protein
MRGAPYEKSADTITPKVKIRLFGNRGGGKKLWGLFAKDYAMIIGSPGIPC